MKDKVVLIQGAMDIEIECLLSKLKNRKDRGKGSNPFEWEPNKRAKDIQNSDLKLVNIIEESLKLNCSNKIYRGI